MEVNYSQNERKIIETYANVMLIFKLHLAIENNKDNFYNFLNIEEDYLKTFFSHQGVANPGMLSTLLYTILVTPWELYKKTLLAENSENRRIINNEIFNLIQKEHTTSSYKGEEDNKNIDFIYHIRNSIAHQKLYFDNEYFKFEDEKADQKCIISISKGKVGAIIEILRNFLNAEIIKIKK
jgi:hypothetical protein